jgi:aspartate/methionine/tyrosine aminotransferase
VIEFSSRLAWHAPQNRITALVEAKRGACEDILDLTESNPTKAGFTFPGGILNAFEDTANLRYDPHPAGLPHAREAVAAATGVSSDRIFLTASTSEAYSYLFKLLADPGDEVLVPRPSYPLFELLASLDSVRAVHYPLVYHGTWTLDVDALHAAATPRLRAVVIVNPNNPTGSFLKRGEFVRLADFCRERNLALISDEVFSSYAIGPDPERVTTLAHNEDVLTFCLNGLSKLCGLPQMKLGWITLAGPAAARERAFAKLEWIADTYLSVGTPVQCAASRLLAAGRDVQSHIAQRIGSNLERLRKAIAGSPCGLLRVEGGWYAILRVPRIRTEEQWCLDLLEHGNVLVQPGFFFDFETEAFLVLSLLTPERRFEDGLSRLLARTEGGVQNI